jgi:hypothetical protein
VAEQQMVKALQKIQEMREGAAKNVTKSIKFTQISIDLLGSELEQAHMAIKEAIEVTQIESNCTHHMEQDIKEIKDAIKSITTPKTWAQVVANPEVTNLYAEMAKKERLEKAKQEQGKSEITISFRDASDATQEKIALLTEQELCS